jgi:hypothetical protein
MQNFVYIFSIISEIKHVNELSDTISALCVLCTKLNPQSLFRWLILFTELDLHENDHEYREQNRCICVASVELLGDKCLPIITQ